MSNHADDVEIAGGPPGFCATLSLNGSAIPMVAVWHDDDHDLAFMLPRDTTVDQINQAIGIYERAYRQGEVYGEPRRNARSAKRSASGTCNPSVLGRDPAHVRTPPGEDEMRGLAIRVAFVMATVGLVQQGVSGITVGTTLDVSSTAGARRIAGVAAGINATEAVNVGQLDPAQHRVGRDRRRHFPG